MVLDTNSLDQGFLVVSLLAWNAYFKQFMVCKCSIDFEMNIVTQTMLPYQNHWFEFHSLRFGAQVFDR